MLLAPGVGEWGEKLLNYSTGALERENSTADRFEKDENLFT